MVRHFSVHGHAASHHSHRPSAWFMSCFSFVCFFSIYHSRNVAMGFWRQKGALGDPVTVHALRVWISTSVFWVFFSFPWTNNFPSPVFAYEAARCSLYANARPQWTKRTFLRASRTLTSSLFSALKFIEKRHCFFKISLAVIGGSVHCWRANRKRVEIDIRGPKTSGAYHQRTSCSAGGSSTAAATAAEPTSSWTHPFSDMGKKLQALYLLLASSGENTSPHRI